MKLKELRRARAAGLLDERPLTVLLAGIAHRRGMEHAYTMRPNRNLQYHEMRPTWNGFPPQRRCLRTRGNAAGKEEPKGGTEPNRTC